MQACELVVRTRRSCQSCGSRERCAQAESGRAGGRCGDALVGVRRDDAPELLEGTELLAVVEVEGDWDLRTRSVRQRAVPRTPRRVTDERRDARHVEPRRGRVEQAWPVQCRRIVLRKRGVAALVVNTLLLGQHHEEPKIALHTRTSVLNTMVRARVSDCITHGPCWQHADPARRRANERESHGHVELVAAD